MAKSENKIHQISPERPPAGIVTRLAPSPTGELHLGNIWSFLLCWLAARASGGQVLLRIDDIDPQRSKKSHTDQIIDILQWLHLDWDNGPVRQSERGAHYTAALKRLEQTGLVYPCFCTRHDLRALAAAPHIGDAGAPYPGTCANLDPKTRQALAASGKPFALRLKCNSTPVRFCDLVQGQQNFSREDYGGDFPLRRSDGVWSYQLASSVDDMETGVNLIVRGKDLLPSTPRQIILHDLLNRPRPAYAHIPLLLDDTGERLAKRHHSLAISQLRKRGVSAERIIGQLAKLANLSPCGDNQRPAELVNCFRLENIPQNNIAIDCRIGNDGYFALSKAKF